jgi:hypothetical protein
MRADTTTHSSVTAAADGLTALVSANNRRLGLILQATVAECYVSFNGSAASASNGIRIPVDGSLFLDTAVPTAAGLAYSSTGTGVIKVTEFTGAS